MNVILLLLILTAQDVIDLGVMSPKRMIMLEFSTNRTDLIHFKIELQALEWPSSNFVSFNTTNTALKMEDFRAMPPGPIMIGVRTIHSDGDESNIGLFKVDLQRDVPDAPKARMVAVPSFSRHQSLTNAMHSIRAKGTNSPAPPIPGGKPMTYSEHIQEMQYFQSLRSRK